MDAFFVAVEVADDPALAGRAVVVGGTAARGVVAAASYEARAYGIHSAMPAATARRLCPHAVFLAGRHARYREVSAALHAVLADLSPMVEGVSLDEAFLDVTGAHRRLGDAATIAEGLRARVRADLGLWCSVGVAPRKLTAKLASEAAKPRASSAGVRPGPGVVVIEPAGELAFLHRHPVEALWGVGSATLARLQGRGVRTIGDLAALPEAALVGLLGRSLGHSLHARSWAATDDPVVVGRQPKSVGHEETFAVDHRDRAVLDTEALRLAEAVAIRLRRAGRAGRRVQVKVRFGDFRTVTRSVTGPEPLDDGRSIAEAARALLRSVDPAPGVRLLGVAVSELSDRGATQLRLDGDAGSAHRERAGAAVDEVRRRFGDAAIGPASIYCLPRR